MASRLAPINIIKNTKTHTGTVFFFHGLGDTGVGIKNWIESLAIFPLPHIKFLFPTAPVQPFTAHEGEAKNAWFDRLAHDLASPEHNESIDKICQDVTNLILDESKNTNISLSRMLVGGFSMGGTLAMNIAYRYLPTIGGVFALSSFLNEDSEVYRNLKDINKPAPILLCHGDQDSITPLAWSKHTYDTLTKLGVNANHNTLEETDHEITKPTLDILHKWIQNSIFRKSDIFIPSLGCEHCW